MHTSQALASAHYDLILGQWGVLVSTEELMMVQFFDESRRGKK